MHMIVNNMSTILLKHLKRSFLFCKIELHLTAYEFYHFKASKTEKVLSKVH